MSTIVDGQTGITFNDSSNQQTAGYTGFRNRIINGAMVIDQRNAGASVTPGSFTYTLDRWGGVQTTASKFSVQQNAASVTPPAGFTNYLGVTSLSAYSVGAGDTFNIYQSVEGFNCADFAWGTASAQSVTLSFWVRSSLTGTFGGAIKDGSSSKAYPFTYTISSASTWEQKSVTIVGPTSGQFSYTSTTNGIGLQLMFGLGAGATYSGTAGAWNSTNSYTATGAVSVVGTNGATFYITGVQLEQGIVATPFERRNYGVEFSMCQRYYFQIGGTSSQALPTGQASAATTAYIPIVFPVTMRTAPSGSNFSVSANSDWYMVNAAVNSALTWTASSMSTADVQTALLLITVASGLVAGNASFAQAANTSARIKFSAEL